LPHKKQQQICRAIDVAVEPEPIGSAGKLELLFTH
jgi:hypothetical protein